MLEHFFPDMYYESTYIIDFEQYYKDGYRGVIFDIDNTLVPHGAPADERSIALVLTVCYYRIIKSPGWRCLMNRLVRI